MTRRDPYSGFRFTVEIGGVIQAACNKVKGMARETRVESFREGGVNDFERKLMTLTSYPNLVLERGLADPKIFEWHQQVVEGRVIRMPITITLRNSLDEDCWGLLIFNAFPVKWSVADFDANSGQVVMESIEFAHHGFLRRPFAADIAA
jgi:phage tail-like protein